MQSYEVYRGSNYGPGLAQVGPYIYVGIVRAESREEAVKKAENKWGQSRPYMLLSL